MLIDRVKVACEVTTDDEGIKKDLKGLINAAKLELQASGILVPEKNNEIPELVVQAIILYCRMHFRSPANYAQLEKAYDRTVGLLRNSDEYTDWGK